MKLIDLLKQELPKRGGWPEGAAQAWQSSVDGEIYFDKSSGTRVNVNPTWKAEKCTDCGSSGSIITREQYEAATEWNGEGLPPIGTECEWRDRVGQWRKTVVKYVSDSYIIVESTDIDTLGVELAIDLSERPNQQFRPLRTERDKAIEEMLDRLNAGTQLSLADAIEQLYDAGYRKV